MQKLHVFVLLVLGCTSCAPVSGDDAGSTSDSGLKPQPDASVPVDAWDGGVSILDERIGAPAISYMNPEFTPDGRYMVWFEPLGAPAADGRLYGKMWHCAVNHETGDLEPADGRGFLAFNTTIWGRANTGEDSEGPYYVGQLAESDGGGQQLVHVRPTGPDTGIVSVLPSQQQPRRRSIFPSALKGRPKGEQYIWWFENDIGFTPSTAENVELKYVSVSDPSLEHVVTRQAAPGPRWSAMDTTYARFVAGTSTLTLGVPVGQSIEVAVFDLPQPDAGLSVVTTDARFKLDPYSFQNDGGWYFVAGINQTPDSMLYGASGPREHFEPLETIRPTAESEIAPADQCQPQSHQTFSLHGQLFSAFQIADCASGSSFLTRRGEIWLTTLLRSPQVTLRLSRPGPEAKNEPEPIVGADRAWVFYTAYAAGLSPLAVQYELRRVTVK